MLDRFGKLPHNIETMFEVARVKNILRRFQIVRVEFISGEIAFTFHEEAEDSLEKILEIVSRDKNRFRFTPDHKLCAKYTGSSDRDILLEIKNILR
jgi:transcription-repair coupling factor (superfamily II helicase)